MYVQVRARARAPTCSFVCAHTRVRMAYRGTTRSRFSSNRGVTCKHPTTQHSLPHPTPPPGQFNGNAAAANRYYTHDLKKRRHETCKLCNAESKKRLQARAGIGDKMAIRALANLPIVRPSTLPMLCHPLMCVHVPTCAELNNAWSVSTQSPSSLSCTTVPPPTTFQLLQATFE